MSALCIFIHIMPGDVNGHDATQQYFYEGVTWTLFYKMWLTALSLQFLFKFLSSKNIWYLYQKNML